MPNVDLYEVLGVPRDADAAQIKSAFRKLARQFHPDVNPDNPEAEEKFKQINSAYEILSDPDKKARYDRFGTTDDQAGPNPGDFFAGGAGFGDLFDMFFGGGAPPRRKRQGRDGGDMRLDLKLTLRDVLHGAERTVSFLRNDPCSGCRGTGAEGGKSPEECSSCQGTGQVSRVQNTFIGQVRTMTACPTCAGEGFVIKDKCSQCAGRGVQSAKQERVVKVPPGFDSGMSLHYAGEGHQGTGQGRSGDLYVVLQVAPDDRFERQGTELLTALEVTFPQAALGDRVTIEGVDGDVELEVAPGSQPGQVIRVKGQGLPALHGGRRGDLHVELIVRVPKTLNAEQERLIRELGKTMGEDPSGPGPGILGNLFRKKK